MATDEAMIGMKVAQTPIRLGGNVVSQIHDNSEHLVQLETVEPVADL